MSERSEKAARTVVRVLAGIVMTLLSLIVAVIGVAFVKYTMSDRWVEALLVVVVAMHLFKWGDLK